MWPEMLNPCFHQINLSICFVICSGWVQGGGSRTLLGVQSRPAKPLIKSTSYIPLDRKSVRLFWQMTVWQKLKKQGIVQILICPFLPVRLGLLLTDNVTQQNLYCKQKESKFLSQLQSCWSPLFYYRHNSALRQCLTYALFRACVEGIVTAVPSCYCGLYNYLQMEE